MNEVRFGGVAALQAEVARLQQEITDLKMGGIPKEGVDLNAARDLGEANLVCGELYCTVAFLWRELCKAREMCDRIKDELKLKEELVNRLQKGESGSFIESLKRSAQLWSDQNAGSDVVGIARESDSQNGLLVQKYRLLLQCYPEGNEEDDVMVKNVMTLGELRVGRTALAQS